MTKKDNIFIDWIKKVGAGIGGGIAGLAAILSHIHLPPETTPPHGVTGSARDFDHQLPGGIKPPHGVTGSARDFDHQLPGGIKPPHNFGNLPPITGNIPNLSQLPHNKEAKDIQANVVETLAKEFYLEIQRIDTQGQNLDPTERTQFLEQSHKTLRGEMREKAVSLVKKENEKHKNILEASEVTTVATSAVSQVLNANNIPKSEDKDNNNNV